MGASRTWGAAVACRTVWMSIGGISSLKSGPSSAMPCLERRRLGIQSANSPPRARFCRRSQFTHEFEWNVGAVNPICPLGTVSLYLSVQLFNRSEFIFRQWTPNDCLQINIASFRHEISICQASRSDTAQTIFLPSKRFSLLCPLGASLCYRSRCYNNHLEEEHTRIEDLRNRNMLRTPPNTPMCWKGLP